MKLEYFNAPVPEEFKLGSLPDPVPQFLTYMPNFEHMQTVASKYAHITDLVVIGHGGSITGFYGLYKSMEDKAKVKAHFLNTVDPDYISNLKASLDPKTTLIVAVSKSGETTTQFEAVFQFLEFPMVFVTGAGSALDQLAKSLEKEVFPHPTIGGRYTGFTEVLLFPAMLVGFPVKEFFESGRRLHANFSVDNDAWKLASVIWQLEQKGISEVFMPFYSKYLFDWNLIVVQLCHESFGKNGLGGTYVAFEAPESQHHTNQRFFGGIKNMAGLFVGFENFGSTIKTEVPEKVKGIQFKTSTINAISGIPLSESMRFEMEGTLDDANAQSIPSVKMLLKDRSFDALGEFLAFWQMYAVYGSVLRKVNPFDQPQVEASKVLSFSKRLDYKK